MKTSDAGRALIVQREGKKTRAYRDNVGVWTIGVGHTGRMTPPKVTAGMVASDEQIDSWLAADLAPVERVINTAVTVPMTQNEFDAMASLGFNIGAAGLKRSSVVHLLDKGDVQGASEAFMSWSKPAVLIGRRKEERAQFLRPDVQSAPVAAARAKVLAEKADATKDTAGGHTKVAVGLAATGAVISAASPAADHHHTVLWVIAGLAVLGAVAAAVLATVGHRAAATLSTNAGKQALVARVTDTAAPISSCAPIRS